MHAISAKIVRTPGTFPVIGSNRLDPSRSQGAKGRHGSGARTCRRGRVTCAPFSAERMARVSIWRRNP